MKKTIKVIVSLSIFINMFTINIFAEDLSYIEEGLINLGVNEEYSENIVKYLENLDVSEEEFQKIESNINDIKDFIENTKSEVDVNFLKYYNVYDNIMDIAEMLNLDLDVDLNSLSITLINKNNNNILFEGDTNSLVQIYSNYKDSNYDINMAEIFQDINSNIKENNTAEEEGNTESEFNNEIDYSLKIERNIDNTTNNNEKNNVLDEYIDKFEKYNESLLVNNNDMLEFKKVLITFGIALSIFIIFKIISKVKRLQENQFEE